MDDFYNRFKVNKGLAETAGFNPYYREIRSGLDEIINIEGREFINLASNNYLGLSTHTNVKKAIINAVEKYGSSLCATPIAGGYSDIYKNIEKRLASFIGLEGAVILPSGYGANNAIFPVIAGRDDLAVVDHFAHSSLIEGIRSTQCKIRPFLHNNMEHLEGILKKSTKYRQIFIVTEGVFSTDGTIAPLKDITSLTLKYNAIPVVDDSHGLGVIGKRGRGVLEDQGIKDFDGIYTASLGKAIANTGGVIAGKSRLIEYLKYYCPHLIYSTALPPNVIAGIDAVLDLIELNFNEIIGRASVYKKNIYNALLEKGFNVCKTDTLINSVIIGNAVDTIALSKRFFDNNIFTTSFIEPSVPPNQGRLRLIAGANLTKESINKVIDVIGRL